MLMVTSTVGCIGAEVTSSVAIPVGPSEEIALISTVPTAIPVASPEASIVATSSLLLVQVTDPVRSAVLPSEYVPVAVNCWVLSITIEAVSGTTSIDVNEGGSGGGAVG